MANHPGGVSYTFGPFLLNPRERLLQRSGLPVHLTPKAFEILLALVENEGRLMGKEELIERVWPDSFVEEGSLAVNISVLRRALGERQSGQKYIENVSGRGYRFVAAVGKAGGSRKSSGYTHSIAVLPFRVISAEADDEYLGLGMADALITKLSRIRQVVVRPTSAVMRYLPAPADPVAAGRGMYVDAVLEGHIRRSGRQIRVTAQLLNVENGTVLWAEKFDQEFVGIFSCEDSISEHVTQALRLRLTRPETRQLTKQHTSNGEAYHLYLRGRYLWNSRTPDNLRKAAGYFEKAVEADPAFALAHAGLADTYILLNTLRPEEAMPKAKAAALRALEIDDTLAEAHSALAFVLENYNWEWEEAEREYKLAVELNPNYATARQWFAEHLAAMGRHEEAIAEIQRAHMLDPLSLSISNSVARQFYFARQYERAAEQCRHTLEMDSNFIPAHYRLGGIYLQMGRYEEAVAEYQLALKLSGGALVILTELAYAYAMAGEREHPREVLDELKRLARERYVEPSYFAQIYIGLDDRDEAFEWLQKTRAERLPLIMYLKADPIFDRLRPDPRFAELLRQVGLGEG